MLLLCMAGTCNRFGRGARSAFHVYFPGTFYLLLTSLAGLLTTTSLAVAKLFSMHIHVGQLAPCLTARGKLVWDLSVPCRVAIALGLGRAIPWCLSRIGNHRWIRCNAFRPLLLVGLTKYLQYSNFPKSTITEVHRYTLRAWRICPVVCSEQPACHLLSQMRYTISGAILIYSTG